MNRITRRTLLAGASIGLISSRVWAQTPSEVKVGLLVPISGLYARPGTVMREGAEMAIDHINAQGGVPIKVGDQTIGAVAVSGAPGGDKDVACANAGLAKAADRLK